MSNQATSETITKYEVLYAVRTGLTVLLPCVPAFDNKTPPSFSVSADNPCDIVIEASGKKILLKGLQKEHLDASVSRGFIMFYETKDDEVVRCTHCNYQKK